MTNDSVRSKPLALALLAVAQFLIILDASIVNVALPSIQSDLHFSPESLSWVVNAYALMIGGFLLLGGRLADLIGRRRVFIAGMTLFGIASLLGGFSNSELQLVLCRGAQGLGAALASPAALSTISVIFKEGKERNKAFGVWGAVGGSGGAVGVLLGGLLTQLLGWEWIFFISVPVALAAALLAPRLLVESREAGKKAYDIPGALTVTAALTAIVYAVVDANNAGWGSLQTVGLLVAGIILIALFVLIELSTTEPLIKFSIFRLPALRAANAFSLINSTCILSLFYVNSLYMQQVLGYDALQTGLGLLPLSLITISTSMLASPLAQRVGVKTVLVAGAVIETLGLFWFAQLSAGGSYWSTVFGPSLVIGFGLGFVFVTVTIAAMLGSDRSNAGLSSGLLNTSQQIGRALGVAITISVFTSVMNSDVKSGSNHVASLANGLSTSMLVVTGLCVLSVLIAAAGMPSQGKPRPEAAPA